MKTVFQVFLKNPQQRTEDEKLSINAIGKKINGCLSDISELKKNDSELFVTIFMGKEAMPDSFKDWGHSIYFLDLTSIRNIGWTAFKTTVKSSLSKLDIPQSVGKVAIVLSLNKVNENDIFAINSGEYP